MTSATPSTALRTTTPPPLRLDAAACRTTYSLDSAVHLNLTIHTSLPAAEAQWRSFEQVADCTPFQSYDWLVRWYRHIGQRNRVRPIIAVAAFADEQPAFLLPLGLAPSRLGRRLGWLGDDLNDYNAPILGREFSQRVTADQFLTAWRQLLERLQREPLLRHHWIELERMPQRIGGQINPFTRLPVSVNASGTHITALGDDWEKFYVAKRSSATRRRDRSKRKHLSKFGELQFITSTDASDAQRTLTTLMDQKSRSLAHKGVSDMFARPGWREFFLEVAAGLPPPASSPQLRDGRLGVHISRVQISSTCAAANLGLVFDDCYFHVLASYDTDVSRYGPGALHLRELLAYAIRHGLRWFDFTIGDEPYKLEWSDSGVKLWDHSSASTWRGWPAHLVSIARRRLKRFLKQTPVLWRMISRARGAVGSSLCRWRYGPRYLHRKPSQAAEASGAEK